MGQERGARPLRPKALAMVRPIRPLPVVFRALGLQSRPGDDHVAAEHPPHRLGRARWGGAGQWVPSGRRVVWTLEHTS